MAGQPDEDPLFELRESLDDGDEPLGAPAPPAPKPAVSRATPAKGNATASQRPSAPGAPGAPPPLPPKRTSATGQFPSVAPTAQPGVTGKSGINRAVPATSPTAPSTAPPVAGLPPSVVRPPAGDPFQEPPEPRLASGADPEEKLKTFRAILKQKEETLARGRSLYKAVDEEAVTLRALAAKLKTDLEAALIEAARGNEYPQQLQHLKEMLEKDTIRADDAEKKMDALVAQLAELDVERKDLSQALAEVESQFTAAKEEVNVERKSREGLADELIGAKEALSIAQDRVAELGEKASEAQGSLEATTEQHTAVSQELEAAQLELETLRQEVLGANEARDVAINEITPLREDLDTQTRLASENAEKLADALGKITALEGEGEWSQSSLDQAQARVAELEEKTAADAAKIDALTRDVTRLETDAATSEMEKSDALGRAAELDGQLNQTRESLAGMNIELEQLRAQVARNDAELVKVRADVETAAVKKIRLELNQANQRAMDSGAALRKEKELREAAEAKINLWEAQAGEADARREAAEAAVAEAQAAVAAAQEQQQAAVAELTAQHQAALAEVESRVQAAEAKASQYAKSAGAGSAADAKLKAVSDQLHATQAAKANVEKELAALKAAPPKAAAPAALAAGGGGAEVEKLRADLAALKKKLGTAEMAIEAAASLKAKVARLEAQLKAK